MLGVGIFICNIGGFGVGVGNWELEVGSWELWFFFLGVGMVWGWLVRYLGVYGV